MTVRILVGDCRTVLPTLEAGSVHTCITSPPYWLQRDYGIDGQLGLEETLDEYIAALVDVFRLVRRALRDDGTLWLNLGDCYIGSRHGSSGTTSSLTNAATRAERGYPAQAKRVPGLKYKDLVGVPHRVAFALQADGWWLRQDIVWSKPNPTPESVRDRPTRAHEYIFLLSKSEVYAYDADAIAEPSVEHCNGNTQRRIARHGERQRLNRSIGTAFPWTGDTRNKRSVWTVTTKPYSGPHYATFPPDLIEPCVLAGARGGGIVLDPFGGTGTVGEVASLHGRDAVLVEVNPESVALMRERFATRAPLLAREAT